jgi:mono/diheme cytochrome c family protein
MANRPSIRHRAINGEFTMRLLAFIGFLAVVAAIGAAVFFFGGFYNVAATEPDPGVVAWSLGHVREASIARHATVTPPSGYDGADNVTAGARAFAARGCVNCHGAPGVMWAKFSEGLRPDPPDLKDVAKEIDASEIYWIVRNGINMTGMPAFQANVANDMELWQIAAFVKKLPDVSDADYKTWVEAGPPPADPPAPK